MKSILDYIKVFKNIETYKGPAPRNMYQDGQLVRNTVDGSRPGYQGEKYVSGYNIKERIANEIKYEKVLTEMLSEIDVMKEKGYGNVSSLVEKYSDQLGLTKNKVKKYYDADGMIKKHAWNVEQSKIRGAVIDAAKQADIIDLPDNMIKAVEDYKKFEGKITRGETAKIIRANKVPESSLYKALHKVDSFVKQKKKWKNIDEKNKVQAAERRATLKKYSSDGFERMTTGSQTIQGGHTGDIYNDFVTPKTKKYTPAFINQETLKQYDVLIKATGEARDKAIKAKDWKKVERLNTKGINIAAASEGYKTFKVVKQDGSSFIYGIDDITTSDPMDLTKKGITAQELTKGKDVEFEKAKKLHKAGKISKAELEIARVAAEKRLFETATHRDLIKVQKEEAMKAAKLSKKEISAMDKRLTARLDDLKNKDFKTTFSKTFQDLSPQSVLQMAKTHKCGGLNEGGSIMSCLQKKFKADPEKFLQRSTPLAKGNPNLRKWFMRGRNIAKGTGVFAAWEAALAPVLMGWMASEGESWDRMKYDLAWGPLWEAIGVSPKFIPGKSVGKEWMDAAGGHEGAHTMKKLEELQDQELPYLYQKRDAAINKLAHVPKLPGREGKGYQQLLIERKIKEKELELQDIWNKSGFMEGPAGGKGDFKYLNMPVIRKASTIKDAADAKVIADKAATKEKYIDWGIVADPDWHKQEGRISRMGGGMVGIRKPSALPPTGGPMSQGLRSLYINDRDY